MFDITVSDHTKPSRLSPSSSQHNSESVRSGPNSSTLESKSSKESSSGPMTPLQPTGLIISGPLGSSAGRRLGQLEPQACLPVCKAVYGSAVTNLKEEVKLGFKVSRLLMWGFLGGGFDGFGDWGVSDGGGKESCGFGGGGQNSGAAAGVGGVELCLEGEGVVRVLEKVP